VPTRDRRPEALALLGETLGLCNAAVGIYHRLRLHIEVSGSWLHGPIAAIYAVAHAVTTEEQVLTDEVLESFFEAHVERTPHGEMRTVWTHERIEEQRQQENRRRVKAQTAAHARWNSTRTEEGQRSFDFVAVHDARSNARSDALYIRPTSKALPETPVEKLALIHRLDALRQNASQPENDLSEWLLRQGVIAPANSPEVMAWQREGVTRAQMKDAVRRSRDHIPEPTPIPVAYLDKVIRTLRSLRARPRGPPTTTG